MSQKIIKRLKNNVLIAL